MTRLNTLYRNNLRKIRISRGISQVEMAELLGISKSELSRIERGEVGDGWTSHICEVLGITRDDVERLSVIEGARWTFRQERWDERADDDINQAIHDIERKRLGMRVKEYCEYAGLDRWKGHKVS